MTMQVSDTVRYKRRRFYLIDCEKDKSLIYSADFNLEGNGRLKTTANYREYTAKYFITNNIISGIKYIDDYLTIKNGKYIDITRKSKRLVLNYTGSIIIARFNEKEHFNTDFLLSVADSLEAYELHFENGRLKESISLFEQRNNGNVVAWDKLKNEYDERTYKWRE